MDDNSLDFGVEPTPPTRPVFLTVLCILTFVGVGLSVIYNLWMFAFLHESGLSSYSHKIERYAAMSVLISVISNGLCLWGALFMWNLKKSGYFIYLGGHILAIVMKVTVENRLYDISNPFGLMNILIFTMMFPAAFLIMYGTNLRYMR